MIMEEKAVKTVMRMSPILRFGKYVNKTEGCWLWTGATNGKYGVFPNPNGNYAHRFSYVISKGEIPKGQCVCHTCDTPLCVNPDHLFLASQQENIFDAVKKGRFANQKLTTKEVEKVKILFEHFSAQELARIFDVHPQTINKIVQERSRTHA